jgi:outer membrane protein TolC
MESEKILEHETTLEHALDVARANFKEAQRLLDEAKAAFAAGDVTEDRVVQLQSLLELAAEDLRRVTREQ